MARRILKLGIVQRPHQDVYNTGIQAERPGPQDRDYELVPLEDLYWLARECNAVRKSIQALRDYIFKEGYEWEPKFSRRCKACGTEYPTEQKPEFCKECGAGEEPMPQGEEPIVGLGNGGQLMEPMVRAYGPDDWYEEPDESEIDKAEEFFERVDQNGHTLIESLKIAEGHLNIADDLFIVARQDYKLTEDGVIVDHDITGEWEGSKRGELVVADPRNFKMVLDPKTKTPGGAFYICLKHRPRNTRYWDLDDEALESHQVHREPGRCTECGMKLHDVWFVNMDPGATATGDDYSRADILEYYIGPELKENGEWFPGEVIHASKYDNSYGYGYAPLVSVYRMADTLVEMEDYVFTFYKEERTPRAAIFIPTRNPEMVRSVWEAAEDKNVSAGGHHIPKFTYDPGEGQVGVEYKEFSKLPEELQYLEVRDEFYRRIGAAFDVMPVFQGNIQAAGLQNQGPTQWQVTIDGALKGQAIYNDKVLPSICAMLGIVDWELKLTEIEEQNEMEEWQVKTMEAQYALTMQQLGFPPESRDPEGHFEFPSKPQQNPMGGMGGMGGMMGGMGGVGGFGEPAPPPVPGGDADDGLSSEDPLL